MLGRIGHPLVLGYILLLAGATAFLFPLLLDWFIPQGPGRFSPQYGDIVAICAFVATVVIAMFSILPNLRSMAEISRSTHYSELDRIYMEILSKALDMPYLRNPEAVGALDPDDDRRRQYDTYAFIVWNFLETIHDRCAEHHDLRDTWGPVIGAEMEIHRDWFEQQTIPYDEKANPKFCLPFCDFIWRVYCREGCGKPGDGATRDGWKHCSWTYRSEAAVRKDPANDCRLRSSNASPARSRKPGGRRKTTKPGRAAQR